MVRRGTRWRPVAVALLAVSLSFVGADRAKAAELPRVKIGWIKLPSQAATFILPQFGKEHGVEIELVEFKRYPDIRTALATGSLDMGTIGPQEIPIVVSQGVTNLVVVAGLDRRGTMMLSRKGVVVRKWADLYGKRIGAGKGGVAWTQFIAACEENGIDYSKLDVFNIVGGGFDHVKLLERGDVDVTLSWEPFGAVAVMKGFADYAPLDITATRAAGAQITAIATTHKVLSERREVIVNVLKALMQAMAHLNAQPQAWVDVIASWGFDVPTATLAVKGMQLDINIHQESLENLARFLFKVGLAKRDVSGELFPRYFTYEVLEEATGKPSRALGAK